jgi:hypothetical protein
MTSLDRATLDQDESTAESPHWLTALRAAKAAPVPHRVKRIFYIRCGEEVHRIGLIGKQLVLLDHDYRIEKGMLKLGADLCGCMADLYRFRSETSHGMDTLSEYRRELQRPPRPMTPEEPWATKWRGRTERIIKELIWDRCSYKTAIGNDRGRKTFRHQTEVHVGYRPGCCGGIIARANLGKGFGGSITRFDIYVGFGWLPLIHNKGLSVIDGKLILQIVDENEIYYYVFAVRQDRGYGTRIDRALVDKKTRKLKWFHWSNIHEREIPTISPCRRRVLQQ